MNKAVKLYIAAAKENRLGHFKKTGTIQARPAKAGEVIITVIDGVTETRNTALDGDFVVTNPGGEKYIVGRDKFHACYEHLEENTYLAKGECYGFEFTGDEGFSFSAPWGEEMIVEPGDFIVGAAPDNFEDIYRIERNAFFATYKRD